MMFASLRTPLVTVVYTLLGVLLAKFWYDDAHWPVALALVVALALAAAAAPVGRAFITVRPMVALRIFESYAWINGLLASVAASATVIVTIELAAVAGKEDPLKELVTQVSSALTALIGGMVVATKDADETLGKRIAKEFRDRFTMEGQPEKGKLALKKDSPALLAVFTNYANNWTDWSADNREARVKCLRDNLATDAVSTTSS